MAFKTLTDLDCEVTTAIGGKNAKTGKPNPTSIEGYYLGSRQVASPKSKTGFATVYAFETAKGKVGVWGKTDLDRKAGGLIPGAMTRVTFTGMQKTANNPMYKYSVEVDEENTIEVSSAPAAVEEVEEEAAPAEFDDASGEDFAEEEAPLDEPPARRPAPPVHKAAAPDAARRAQVQALLNKGRGKTA